MTQNVLDGVLAIEARAAKAVERAEARARELRQKVQEELDQLATQLDREAEEEIARYTKVIETRKATALGELDQQLEAALSALEAAKAERVAPLAEEVARLLERRAHGH